MSGDDEIDDLVQLVDERLQFVHKTVNGRENLYGRKREEHLMAIIRQVVTEYYKKFDHTMEEIVRKIRSYFP